MGTIAGIGISRSGSYKELREVRRSYKELKGVKGSFPLTPFNFF
jgi:hypothetical protein